MKDCNAYERWKKQIKIKARKGIDRFPIKRNPDEETWEVITELENKGFLFWVLISLTVYSQRKGLSLV